ncbi:MAG TPA: hypothetical protein VGS19_35810 [Streptosporangiaceae bacterium]|nr:hypothetical protein [Streptosporangiaceae bacterium]
MTTTPETDQLAMLRHTHGQRWEFFVTGRVVGGTLWLARRRDSVATVRAHSAAELDKRVREWEPGTAGESSDRTGSTGAG